MRSALNLGALAFVVAAAACGSDDDGAKGSGGASGSGGNVGGSSAANGGHAGSSKGGSSGVAATGGSSTASAGMGTAGDAGGAAGSGSNPEGGSHANAGTTSRGGAGDAGGAGGAVNAGGAGGDGAATTGPVHGHVIDQLGNALAGMEFVIGGEHVTSDSAGSLATSAISGAYDAIWLDPEGTHYYAWRQLERRDPVFTLSQPATSGVTIPIELTSPVSPDDSFQASCVCDGGLFVNKPLGAATTISLDMKWPGSADLHCELVGLEFSGTAQVPGPLSAVKVQPIVLQKGVAPTKQSLALAATNPATVIVHFPILATFFMNSAMNVFVASSGQPNAFLVQVPPAGITKSTLWVGATVSADGSRARQPLLATALGDQVISFDGVPSALAPADAAVGVETTTQFSWIASASTKLYTVELYLAGKRYTVYSSGDVTSLQLSDLAATGLDAPGASGNWKVISDDRADAIDSFVVSNPSQMTRELTSGQNDFTMAGTLPPGN